jgi:Skp family chaperone for outer membrane proteins
MRTAIILAAVIAVPGAALAQDTTPAPACYIEVQKLFGEPPAGIGELGAAIRTLETQLRPQVEAINAIKAQIARLEQRQEAPAANAQQAMFEEEDSAPAADTAPPADDGTAQELTRLEAELKAKQDQLKTDYAAQQQALVGPVQARVSRGAQFFANTNGCAEMKLARAPDLAALTAAGARDMTGAFVTWYLSDQPG